jgi:hypothetical protein
LYRVGYGLASGTEEKYSAPVNALWPGGKIAVKPLLVAVRDSTLRQIVRRQFHGHAVTRQHANAVAAQPAREMRQHGAFLIELNAELPAWKFLNNSSSDFDAVFFAHFPPLSVVVDISKSL